MNLQMEQKLEEKINEMMMWQFQIHNMQEKRDFEEMKEKIKQEILFEIKAEIKSTVRTYVNEYLKKTSVEFDLKFK